MSRVAKECKPSLPTPKPRKERPERTAYAAILQRADGAVLLERATARGHLGRAVDVSAVRRTRRRSRVDGDTGDSSLGNPALPPYSHSFTHFDLTLEPLLVRDARERPAVAEADKYCWYDVKQPAKIGLAKPAVDLIRGLTGES